MPPPVRSTAGPADDKLTTLVPRAIEEARAVAVAEIALYKAKAGERLVAYRNAAIFFGIAAVLALSAVTALLVGLIITLATLIGPGLATAVVVVGVLVVAAILGLIGKRKLAPPDIELTS